jgi:hypothetical protein
MSATYNYGNLKIANLNDVALDQGGSTTLANAISAWQSNLGLSNNCPQCVVSGSPTGWVSMVINGGASVNVQCPTCGGNLKTAAVYVANPLISGAYIALVITGVLTAAVGKGVTLGASVAGGTWSSATTSVATINSTTGVVTAVATGTTVITYTYSGVSVTATFSVTSS